MNKVLIIDWALRLALAGLYIAMGVPKFGDQAITIHIFTSIGVEPWGRYFTGVIEILIAVMLLVPKTTLVGVLLSLATLTGALLAHFLVLGIVIQNDSGSVNDGGQIFSMAIVMLVLTILSALRFRKANKSINAF